MIGNIGDIKSEYSLFIALHPNKEYSAYADALLNGIEVFKLNNSDGNLGRPNPEPKLPEKAPRKRVQKTRRGNCLFLSVLVV